MATPEFSDLVGESAPATPDASQRLVVEAGDEADLLVLGAPGTGKTVTLVEAAADRVLRRGWRPEEVLAVTAARGTATVLRDRLGARLGVTTSGPLARSVSSLAFDIATGAARAAGAAPPRLMTGGEQDNDIAELLRTAPATQAWPEPLGGPVRGTRGFRSELRELLARATEWGLSPHDLAALGARHGHPEWSAAGRFFARYRSAVAQARPDQFDAVELVQFAVAALARGEAGATASRLRLVLVDDVQEAPASAVALLAALAARGVHVIAFGDPDVATSAFRGAEPDLSARLAHALVLPQMGRVTLETVHRHGAGIRELARRVSRHIGTAGVVGHRAAQAAPRENEEEDDDELAPAVALLAASKARQSAALAHHLRALHLIRGIGYDQMAVVVRSGTQGDAIARALAASGVPTRTSAAQTPLRAQRAARALLTVVDVGCGRTPAGARLYEAMLLGPYGGLDRLGLRRLRLALRAEELQAGGERTADALLVAALAAPGRLATLQGRPARQAEHLVEVLAAVRAAAEAGSDIEELLWCAWNSSGLARTMRSLTGRGGVVAAQADRDLDAVTDLFTAAQRFVERRPSAPAQVFLAETLEAEVPEDTLSPRPAEESVLVTTPPGAVGIEVDVVVVAGLQDGAWPDLRPRGSLLHADALVDVLSGVGQGVVDERRRVLDDELRMFLLALSRARRQVVLTALESEDEAPCAFFALLPELARLEAPDEAPLSLPGMAGLLRRRLTSPQSDEAMRRRAASGLAQLAAAGVPGAHPDDWLGLMPPSTSTPLFTAEEEVPVAPSTLEALEASPLDWFVDGICDDSGGTAAGIGTILHWAMQTVSETASEPGIEAVWEAVRARWPELTFEAPWLESRSLADARRLALGLADYLADAQRDGMRCVAAEQRFTVPVGRAAVSGIVDRIECSSDGRIVIVDLKTGRPIRKKDVPRHPQLGAYQLAYRRGAFDEVLGENPGRTAGGAKLLFVREGIKGKRYRDDAVQPAMDEAAYREFCERIEAAVRLVSVTRFPGPGTVPDHGVASSLERRLRRVREITDG